MKAESLRFRQGGGPSPWFIDDINSGVSVMWDGEARSLSAAIAELGRAVDLHAPSSSLNVHVYPVREGPRASISGWIADALEFRCFAAGDTSDQAINAMSELLDGLTPQRRQPASVRGGVVFWVTEPLQAPEPPETIMGFPVAAFEEIEMASPEDAIKFGSYKASEGFALVRDDGRFVFRKR